MIHGTVNGIAVEELESLGTLDTLVPPTYPQGSTPEELEHPDAYGEDSGPVTLRSPSWGQFPITPSYSHWPAEETCAPSSGHLCMVGC